MLRCSSGKYWSSAAATSRGHVRSENEDTYLIDGIHGLWAVADGMGGHQQGSLASQLVAESLLGISVEDELESRLEQAARALQAVNFHLSCERTLTAPQQMIGSTAMVLIAQSGRASCLWVGDSRCYLLRRGVLYQISEDHSLVQQWVNAKRITPEEAKQHPQNNVITRAIGASPDLLLASAEFELYADDMLLLCSDGLYREVSTDVLIKSLSSLVPEKAVKTLMQHGLAGAASDNITVVVVRIN